MKYFNTIFFFLLVYYATAQPTIRFDLHQSFGNEWGLGVVEDTNIDDLPIPLAGENVVWDYSFLGGLDNGYGVLFSEAELEDFYYATFSDIENLPLKVGGTVQDSFPNGTGVLFEGDFGDRDGYILSELADGIERIGEIWDNNFGTFDIDERSTFMLYPFDLAYGDFIEKTRSLGYIINTYQDSLIYTDTFTYIGYGTLKMYFGDVPNVVLYKQTQKESRREYSLITGQLIYESSNFRTAYLFLQNGNLLPLIYYSYSAYPDWSPITGSTDVAAYIPFSPIINKVENAPILFSGSNLSPNPASEKVTISYQLKEISDVNITLYTDHGIKVAENTFFGQSVGEVSKDYYLPANLTSGIYFLKISAGKKSDIKKLIIQR